MTNPLEIHHEAMEWAEEGQVRHDRGDQKGARDAFHKAMELEREAARAVGEIEPDRSVLFRSAGSLALHCNELRAAEQLLAMGLAGDPPEEIAEETRDVLEQVHFRRHLDLRGLALEASEVQMSIAGEAVGHGVASSDEFVARIRDFEALVLRTAERRLGMPYREGGSPQNRLKDVFGVFVSVPRAASFAVTLKVGKPRGQMEFWPDDEGPAVIDEVLDLLDVVQESDGIELARRIPERPYLRNFAALAQRLAPDGEHVRLVGLTSYRPGQPERRVELTKPRRELGGIASHATTPDIQDGSVDLPAPSVNVTGLLHYASVIGTKRGTIKLEDESGLAHEIYVPEGMMSDIVRPLWDNVVRVTGVRRGQRIELTEIVRVED